MFAILCTDGQMKLDEVRNECLPGKWVPLFAYWLNGEEHPNIPVFHDSETAKAFIKKNLPPEWIHGGVQLTDRDVKWMEDKGWRIRQLSYPQRIQASKICKIGLEVLELEVEPDFAIGRL
jgi:hypothetical protein